MTNQSDRNQRRAQSAAKYKAESLELTLAFSEPQKEAYDAYCEWYGENAPETEQAPSTQVLLETPALGPSFPSPWEHGLPRADAVLWHLLTNPKLTPDERTFRSEIASTTLITLNLEDWLLSYGTRPDFAQLTPLSLHILSPLSQHEALALRLSSPIGKATISIRIVTLNGTIVDVTPDQDTILASTPVSIPLDSVTGDCAVTITGTDQEGRARILWAVFCSVEVA